MKLIRLDECVRNRVINRPSFLPFTTLSQHQVPPCVLCGANTAADIWIREHHHAHCVTSKSKSRSSRCLARWRDCMRKCFAFPWTTGDPSHPLHPLYLHPVRRNPPSPPPTRHFEGGEVELNLNSNFFFPFIQFFKEITPKCCGIISWEIIASVAHTPLQTTTATKKKENKLF